jgi:glutathione S-transferase
LFNPAVDAPTREATIKKFGTRLDYIAKDLGDKPYLMGEDFTVADAYLFTVLRWAPLLKVDVSAWPSLQKYVERVAARPGVQVALKAEGLVK